MKTAHAVIGAGWGDEGKGLSVDAISASLAGDVLVVRSNGGAQAGHGVHTPDGRHHVFHHVASGSFAGARTHLSRFFVGHPMVLFDELDTLRVKGVAPVLSMDPRALVTTPWDMAINQSLEYIRGGGRHGSCGLGFGEAIERAERGLPLTFGDLSSDDLDGKLIAIKNKWTVNRIRELGLDKQDYPLKDILEGNEGKPVTEILLSFLEDCERFRSEIRMMGDAEISKADHVIFEGAQGLRLDMDLGSFPWVTRSLTGLPNMADIAREAGIEVIDALYVTRAYGTRHGAGPMTYETGHTPPDFAKVVDLTNLPNEWQGDIRYGLLDLDGMSRVIRADLSRVAGVTVRPRIGVTCIDQIGPVATIVANGEARAIPVDAIPDFISKTLDLDLGMTSRGPDRSFVTLHENEIMSPSP